MPGPGRLLQAVECLVQVAGDVVVALLVARGLLNVHLLLQLAVEESSLDVQLVDLAVVGGSDGQQGAQGGKLADGGEDLLVVDALALAETLGDEAGLVPLHGAGAVALDLEHPFDGDGVDALRGALQRPGVVVQQGCILLVHGLPPEGGLL